ncbi:sodium:solute symporter family protein [Desulfovibrio aminophilus]|nr:sodium:solute symporter family protein [Desulfovibrio aminophilus]MCM0755748.1 sodium:solute symporter family protein [Desulfovibrio aminophilus]
MVSKLIVSIIYFAVVFYLGYKGWKETKSHADYLLAGRRMGPFVMAMSYGATFISTSAIIGFGGVAANFGFSIMWLVFLNIFVGIFVAFAVFGKRTRRMGLALDSHTFPELLGRRYRSKFMQSFSGAVIFVFIPLYAAAVLIGICRMMEVSLGLDFHFALVLMTLILAVYVITGGLKAVMYTEAFQGAIMVGMMLMLLVVAYSKLGGMVQAHQTLTDMAPLVPEKLQKMGLLGWTQGIAFPSPLWMIMYTSLIYGVGFGVLAQPQLIVRFMTVPSDRELNRGVIYGGLFILLIPGVAYVVGALSNAIFLQQFGKISIDMAQGNVDKIIPTFIETIMPSWYSALFLLAMFAAAMSTLASQYHVGGTALGRDVCEQFSAAAKAKPGPVARAAVTATVFITLLWAWILPGSIIARATAFFFGLCLASFLPAFLLGLYWKGMTKAGALASLFGGFFASMFWMFFVNKQLAETFGICSALTGQATLLAGAAPGSWPFLLQFVDPNVMALPVSFILALAVSLASEKYAAEHVEWCWRNY